MAIGKVVPVTSAPAAPNTFPAVDTTPLVARPDLTVQSVSTSETVSDPSPMGSLVMSGSEVIILPGDAERSSLCITRLDYLIGCGLIEEVEERTGKAQYELDSWLH